MSKVFINTALKYVPQMDMRIQYTENGGVEGTQTFIARKANIGSGSNLNAFKRGTTWETVYPEVPSLYRFLTMKTFDPEDSQPGCVAIKATFTGYQFAGNGSSGEEDSVPTTSLRGNLEQAPIQQSKAWADLEDDAKTRLGWLMTLPGTVSFDLVSGKYGKVNDETGDFTAFPTEPGVWANPTGDELTFAKMIASGRTTYDAPSWNYNYRTESKNGFTGAQLNSLGKIVASPPGGPAKPTSGWTWQLIGPEQDQSGRDRFVKDLNYKLIRDNDENQMLYGS